MHGQPSWLWQLGIMAICAVFSQEESLLLHVQLPSADYWGILMTVWGHVSAVSV